MAEREPIPETPHSTVPGVGDSALSFDVAALDGTVGYPDLSNAAAGVSAVASTGPAADGGGEPAKSREPGVVLPHIPGFRLLGVLGGGGMGTVFQALHLAMDKVVALKLINAGWAYERDFRIRFEREVKALAKLEHPNIVPIYDAGNWQGLPYLTMKFVPGGTLHHHLDRLRRDPRAAARVLAKVARAVHFLHDKAIVHRDLKPLNILLSEDDTPLVADFGLVRLTDDDAGLSITLVPLGTRQYMSPEQTRGGKENYTPACDIWALGIILYELLAGHRPFAHEDTEELYRRIRHDPLPPLPPGSDAPASLEAIARKCLAKSPCDRYATAGDVATDLERWLAGEEIPLPAAEPVPEPPTTVAAPAEPPTTVAAPAAPPPRRLRWAVVGAALVPILAFSGAPRHSPRPSPEAEPAPPVRTVAERLAADETVRVVGPTGLPLVKPRRVPGWDFDVNAERDGCTTLSAVRYAAAELLDEPLPRPVLLKAEVALRGGHTPDAWGGMYVCGKKTAAPNGNHYTFVSFARRHFAATENKNTRWYANHFAQLVWTYRDGAGYKGELAGSSAPWAPPTETPPPLVWSAVSVELRPDRVTGRWDASTLGPVTDATIQNQSLDGEVRRKYPDGGPTFVGLLGGTGIGLMGYRVEVVVRNVELVPIR